MSNELNQIIFDHIDDKYAYGNYGEFKVIIMKKNTYINATKLCKEYGKEFKHWNENKNNKELIDEVNKEISWMVGNPTVQENKSFIIIKGGKNYNICGTYVHSLLIPHIASWISPQFGIKVSKIVNNFITDEYKLKIKEKDNKIITLEEKLDTIISTNKELLNKNDLTLEELKQSNKDNKEMKSILEKNQLKLDKTYDKLVGAHEQIKDIEDKLDDTNYKLDVATDDRVVKSKDTSTLEYLIILRTEDPLLKTV
jgi:hypothetical protein